MNKKIIIYFLTALVVLIFKPDSSYSTPTISKYNDGNPDFWTPEKIKKAKPLKTRNIGFRTRSSVKTRKNKVDSSKYTKSMPPFERKYDIINNTINVANVDQLLAFPIGILLIRNAAGELFTCTASVISTDNGNIGLTAAHCLFNYADRTFYNNIMFSPGFNNGQLGPLGLIPVAQVVVTDEFFNNNDDHFDWGMMRFAFNVENHPLQYYSGALGFTFNVGGGVRTVIRGYPDEGNLQNCPNDGLTLCTWAGVANLAADYYVIPELELGNGASGSPCIMNYDPNTNLGVLYSDYASFDELQEVGLAPIYNPIEFQALIGELTL
ncbi:hypothetical protein Glove_692g28 [Diversispora epigaea]|uniref:Peptidase S1 domain-containing protein n=1 Tax=Diversispora epigaea TaxID=1348612 RepID=A0A397G6U3_9GLOM|nr:hypothetical protein Glove_692g28 [Diversispora epigaea]